MAHEDTSSAPTDQASGAATVEIRTAARAALIPTVRAVASDLAARADFDLDAISDLRMAVDEACATLVGLAAPGSSLRCTFDVHGERIDVSARVHTGADAELPTDSFGWRVLQTLADQVAVETGEEDGGGSALTIRLHKLAGPGL
ncbi:Serine-protein kinase RsbW [Pseudonocardia sp. Ae168_Ps1]|uniref:ATP-binding protein n=1 Tax=unclassified Pseudonocardia TaxID=2619320 RepID=UPI0001FFE98E|nr:MULTISPECIES: ATP-binding protein [unclassified Pseudonocardia]ALE74689.1 anti-sigma factor [Pseudonocardia sp. EC080625-04]ALL78120.1 anti-sigma factor [Pseudonocardia sp. EC080610-09]ALL81031.1 anti-sigma factor [Pseudonocardia sp. EC080619-01]OLL76148.1 Serine-protein kinase RsbW [Pseudonocardia sp. Ae150A_Ps1]OLL82147.1 Serine-protein kinase RsbW [Pseudonocardia sp. Ae168_Ps1]